MSDNPFKLEDFFHQTTLHVRFGDIDSLGHVNNAKYLTYIEQARICYARDILGWDGSFNNLGMILASTTVDYKLPMQFGDTVRVLTRVSRIGSKSFDMLYVLKRDSDPTIFATGSTVLVAYDYHADQSIRVPDEWREKILAFDTALRNAPAS
ncbi:MAG: acyl-CoA thioesterase [Anaerolineales bacterium]|nr:acyl-CoA thioesterase [Anaerolineales bacterium]